MGKKEASQCSCNSIRMSATVRVGEKWQIVIPTDVREELEIKPGDTLQVLVKAGKAIGLIKTDNMLAFMEYLSEEIQNQEYIANEKIQIEKAKQDILSSRDNENQ